MTGRKLRQRPSAANSGGARATAANTHHRKRSRSAGSKRSPRASTSFHTDDFDISGTTNAEELCWDDVCHICRDGGNLICCSACVHAFHAECIYNAAVADADVWCCLHTGQRCSKRGREHTRPHQIESEPREFEEDEEPKFDNCKLSNRLKMSSGALCYKTARCEDVKLQAGECVQLLRSSVDGPSIGLCRVDDDSDDDDAEYDFLRQHPPIARIDSFYYDDNKCAFARVHMFAYPEQTMLGRRDRYHPQELLLMTAESMVELSCSQIVKKVDVQEAGAELRHGCRYLYRFLYHPHLARVTPILHKGMKAWQSNPLLEAVERVSSTAPPKKRSKTKKAPRYNRTDALQHAIAQLELSAAPNVMPCRDVERQQIDEFVLESLHSEQGGSSLYICGMPGTGKTATVVRVIHSLMQDDVECPDFDYLEINAVKLQSPAHAYSAIWAKLKGEKCPPAKALLKLQKHFQKKSKSRKHLVLVIDEFDYLMDKKQKVIFNIVDLQTWPSSRLIIIAIANTLDLPDRLMARVDSRVGVSRVDFKPYSFEQIEQIVWGRLQAVRRYFDSSGLELCARKVAGVCGDVRRALRICSRAIELCLDDAHSKVVTIGHVTEAVRLFDESLAIAFIKGAAFDVQLYLVSLVQELRISGTQEANYNQVQRRYEMNCKHRGRSHCSYTDLKLLCQQLHNSHVIELHRLSGEPLGSFSSVSLNLLPDDVRFALSTSDKLADALG